MMRFPQLLCSQLLLTLPLACQTPRDAVLSAFTAEAAMTQKRTRIDVRAGPLELTQTIEVAPPDRIHVVTRRNGFTSDAYVIGRTVFVGEPGAWRALPVQGKPPLTQNLPSFGEILKHSLREVAFLDQVALNGVATNRYRLKISLNGTLGHIEGASHVWIDKAKNLPVKVEFDGVWNGQPYKSAQIIEYDPTIQIDPPTLNP